MGLDVYVGTLTRYYVGDWKVRVPARTVSPDSVTDPEQIRPAVLAWRDGISAALGAHLAGPLLWDEGIESPSVVVSLDWCAYAALVLWAAYEAHPDGVAPPAVSVRGWRDDPVYQASNAAGARSRYPQLLHRTELWLPNDFPFTFHAPDVSGQPITIGSGPGLRRELMTLNARTWRVSARGVRSWREGPPDVGWGGALEVAAQYAFAMLDALTDDAVANWLPIKLDY